MNIASLILAAGGSTRLGGSPKQLLRQEDTTLVRHITEAALALQAGPVIVVLGANQDQIGLELDGLSVHVVANDDWQSGMASSLQVGLQTLWDEPVEAFLVLLTDQPFVNADLLQQLIQTRQQTNQGIVACRYGEPGNLGVPALFSIQYKDEFMRLTGDVGARKLIRQHLNDCAEISFPLANIDLDTWDDVTAWQKSKDDAEGDLLSNNRY